MGEMAMGAVLPLRSAPAVSLSSALTELLADCQLRGLSPHTIEWYQYTLRPFIRFAGEDASAVDEQMVRHFLAEQATRVAPRRVNHYREAIYRFYEWMLSEEYVAVNPAARIDKMREPRKLIEAFTEAEVVALLEQPDTRTFLGLRDCVFMLLLLDTGLRLSEALGLTLEDVDIDQRTIKVVGKGNKERIVGFSDALLRELLGYMARREAVLDAGGQPDCPWMFPNQHARKLAPRGIRMQLTKYATQAGIGRVRVSPHTFRHTFALWFVREGGSPFHLQKILGHSSLDMSLRYCRLADTDAVKRQQELSPLVTMGLPIGRRNRLR